MAKDKCQKWGWKVIQNIPDTCKGNGVIVISKDNRFISIPYELPEHPDLMEDKLTGAMEARRK